MRSIFRLVKGAILVTIMLSVQFASAKPTRTSVPKEPAFKWDPKTETTFASMMCSEGEYFRECFSTTKTVCEKAFRSESRACEASFVRGKRKFESEVQLFAEIGTCTGTVIEKKWRDRKASSTKCDRKDKWQ